MTHHTATSASARSAGRALAIALAVAAGAAVTIGAGPLHAEPDPASVDPELGPLIGGRSSYVEGTHVWTDFAWDDTGPDSDGLDGGDAAYPEGSSHNGADLIQLQLSSRQGALQVVAVLETLIDGEEALVGVGLDVDRDPTTGAPSVPGGQWANSTPLGLEHLVLIGTDGEGQLLSWDGGALSAAGGFAVTTDRPRNVVSAAVPQLALGNATSSAVGLIGLETAAGSWVDGTHPVQDLAFVHAEDPTSDVVLGLREQVPQLGFVPYPDKVQADVLAGDLPPHRAVATVEFGTARTELAEPRVGYNTFLYHSRVVLPGEGIQQDPRIYRGVYMPYGVLIPPGLPANPPMMTFLHGANQHHRVNPVLFSTEGLVIPGPYDVPAVVIFPNGRTTGWGTALAEKDALDATDDAIARLGVDADRVVLTGISSGGMGTFRIAARWPDRWTGAYSLVGGGTANLENLTNLPFRASNGALDPLVNVRTWHDSATALEEAATVDYRIVLVHNRSHDGPLEEGNCYFLDLLGRDRVTEPGRVRYTIAPHPVENEYLSPDGAYWVSGMTPRAGPRASVDATSLAKPERVAGEDIVGFDQNVTKTADFCGPHPELRGGNHWEVRGRSFTTVERADPANAMDIVLTNIGTATVDVVRAGIDTDRPVTLTVTSDGETELLLAGGWSGSHEVSRDGGEPAIVHSRDGVIAIDVVEGTQAYEITRG